MRATIRGRDRSPRTLALGTWLATRGALAGVALVLTAVGAGATVVASLVIARNGGAGAAQIPAIASSALAWGAGIMLAFGAAFRAILRDMDEGVFALVRARGGSSAHYVRGRVGGLVVVLAIALGGATLIASLAATSVASLGGGSTQVARSGAGAVAYALAFSATMGPVAMACLGALTRVRGYFVFLAVLMVPEIAAPWTAALLPAGWHELTSIAAALDAVRAGVSSPEVSGAHLARAVAALVALVSLCLVAVGAQLARIEGERVR